MGRRRDDLKKGKLGAYAMKRVAAGAHLLTPWIFKPARRPDDKADYCLDCSFLPQWKYSFLHLSGVRRALWANRGEGTASQRTGPPSNADYFSCLKGKPGWHRRVPTSVDCIKKLFNVPA